MAFNDTFQRLERLAIFIQRKSTGTVDDLAVVLQVSPRTVKNLLEQLRQAQPGINIKFCRKRRSYLFEPDATADFKILKKKQ